MLVAVLDWERAPEGWEDVARAASPLVDVFILRAKREPAARQCALAEALMKAAGPAPVLVADRLDVALAVGAAGVHLPGDGLLPRMARKLWGRGIISRAVHQPQDLEDAAGADWLIYGHLFATRSKPNLDPRGVAAGAAVVRRAGVPVVGIGGVTAARAAEVRRAGFSGMAVVDALWGAPDPQQAARDFRTAWEAGGVGGEVRET
jgi:thiazole tautomerase (transcriptional regulator TenI)